MRLVIQRVASAKVVSEGKTFGEIQKGLFVLVGFETGDKEETIIKNAQKLFKIRLMDDDEGKINLAVKDVDGAFLVVSQFTLLGDISDGNRPSFVKSETPERARKLYDLFVNTLRDLGAKVETGNFGKHMDIDACLEGPVTIIVNS